MNKTIKSLSMFELKISFTVCVYILLSLYVYRIFFEAHCMSSMNVENEICILYKQLQRISHWNQPYCVLRGQELQAQGIYHVNKLLLIHSFYLVQHNNTVNLLGSDSAAYISSTSQSMKPSLSFNKTSWAYKL